MDRGRTSQGPWNDPDDDSDSYNPDTYDETPPRRRIRRDEGYDVPPRRGTRDISTSQQLPGRRAPDSEQYGSGPSTGRRTRKIGDYDDDYAPARRRVRR